MLQSLFIFHQISDCLNEVRKLFDNPSINAALAEMSAVHQTRRLLAYGKTSGPKH